MARGNILQDSICFCVLLCGMWFQTAAQLAENNPLQHYYLSPAVIAAMSFSMIVYQAAYLCRHDDPVNNHRVPSFWAEMWDRQCVTHYVDCHFYGNREILRFWRVPPQLHEGYYQTVQSIELKVPAALTPSLPAAHLSGEKKFTAALPLKLKKRKKKRNLSWKSMWQPNVHSQWPFDQFILKIQLNCHRGRKESHMCLQCGHQEALEHQKPAFSPLPSYGPKL